MRPAYFSPTPAPTPPRRTPTVSRQSSPGGLIFVISENQPPVRFVPMRRPAGGATHARPTASNRPSTQGRLDVERRQAARHPMAGRSLSSTATRDTGGRHEHSTERALVPADPRRSHGDERRRRRGTWTPRAHRAYGGRAQRRTFRRVDPAMKRHRQAPAGGDDRAQQK